MITAKCDEEGPIQLGPDVRQRYGEKFLVVERPDELILRPVPKDPVKDIEEWGKPLQHLSLEEIKNIIDKRAMEEVGG